MYTRSYGQSGEQKLPTPPENYDGTAFILPESTGNHDTGEPFSQTEETESVPASVSKAPRRKDQDGPFSFLRGIPFIGGLFSGEGGGGFLSGIGAEELLIIGIALFLILSKDGDTECALMLLLLLFIRD